MTSQTKEKLIFNGETVGIETLPLASYLSMLEDKPRFFFMGSNCWRGYVGTWRLIEDKLYLVHLKGYAHNDNKEYWAVDMNFLFPHQKQVFAEWFTGEIIITQGAGYSPDFLSAEPTYERELILMFEKGYFIGKRTVDNHEKIIRIKEIIEKEEIRARKEELRKEREMKRNLTLTRMFRWFLGKATL